MASILSLLLYLGIFTWGLHLDRIRSKVLKINVTTVHCYTIVIYLFLCFGYMCGSDWRSYEDDFYHTNFGDYSYDIAFQYLFYLGRAFFKDYFLFVGILKIAYLYTLIKLIKSVTPYWISSISILMPISLCFMLIDNPLRFMVALVFINIGFYSYFQKNIILTIVLFILSIFFHSSCAFVIILFLFTLLFADKIGSINSWVLIISYLLVFIISSNQNLILSISEKLTILSMANLGSRDYSYYFEDINKENVFALGNVLKIFIFFILVIFHNKEDKNNTFIYGVTIISFFLDRFVIMVPAGMRLVIPLQYFYAIYIVNQLYDNRKYIYIVIFILVFSWIRNLWIDYRYIPYSNSIPYITFGHKPYNERANYNYIEHKKRIINNNIQ